MIFVAVEGVREKGINFSDKAIEAGAKVILCHKKDSKKILKKKITILTAKDIKLSYVKISKKFFPKQPKNISAITGTNGKTSIAFYLNKIWQKANLTFKHFLPRSASGDDWSEEAIDWRVGGSFAAF